MDIALGGSGRKLRSLSTPAVYRSAAVGVLRETRCVNQCSV